ncbi:hypothetical protein N665_0429s0005 [Sinapis alba]|nr:hypothetical protein N665_0429s0005 [Sinapis alba]
MEINELLKKGHLKEFLSSMAKYLLNKEITNQPTGISPASSPRHDRVISIIYGGSEDIGKQQEFHQYRLPNRLQLFGLEEDALTQKVTPLVEFSRGVKQTTREVMLPVYAERINMYTTFLVVDCKSSYNMIFKSPWNHDMGAVSSTLNQVVKFLTPWGIKEIKGDQENS